jgi:hypothetical protein
MMKTSQVQLCNSKAQGGSFKELSSFVAFYEPLEHFGLDTRTSCPLKEKKLVTG